MQDNMIKWMRTVALFNKWSRTALKKLMHGLKEMTVSRGAQIIYENEVCNMFFIIQDGEFALSKKVIKPLSVQSNQENRFLESELKRLKQASRRVKSRASTSMALH